jgi:hypothetical protein
LHHLAPPCLLPYGHTASHQPPAAMILCPRRCSSPAACLAAAGCCSKPLLLALWLLLLPITSRRSCDCPPQPSSSCAIHTTCVGKTWGRTATYTYTCTWGCPRGGREGGWGGHTPPGASPAQAYPCLQIHTRRVTPVTCPRGPVQPLSPLQTHHHQTTPSQPTAPR